MTLSMTYPTPLPSTKGWGPGWPNCREANIRPHPIFQGGVHTEIFALTNMLVDEIKSKGYRFHDGWSWGFDCRATKGGNGDIPSFHSWGLALDFNAPENQFGAPASQSDINVHNHWIVPLMASWGFFWLGPPIGDWMHFHFTGSPQDAANLTAKAKKEGLGIVLSAEDRKTLDQARALLDGADAEAKASSFAGLGKRIGQAVVDVEKGHRHDTAAAILPDGTPLPNKHTHGKTSKS
jgi:hypothetical protein